MRKNKLLRATVLAVACSLSMAVSAQSDVPKAIDISPGDLVGSLQALTRQSGAEFVYREDLLAGLRTQGIHGTLTAEQALEKLLEGSGFTVKRDPSGALMIIKSGTAVPEAEPQAATRSTPTAAQSAEPEPEDLEKITVTGTRIRGGTSPSPVITIGSERIQEEGFTDLGEVIRSLPQNFSGGQNPGVLMGNIAGAGLANQNITGGSGLNLRGLGPDASLTLLNGRRMAYSGFVQAVDISSIPVQAVERMEIVADGASAIYGSDAVGGVANVILKRGFDGVTVGARYGMASDGGGTTREYTATGGGTWAGGGLIATYKDVSTKPIFARQRRYTNHLAEPQMLLPHADQRSALLSIYQSVGEATELRLDALRTEREQLYSYYGASPTLYNVLAPQTTTSFVSPGVEFFLPNDWSLSVGGVWGKDEHVNHHSRVTVGTGASALLYNECICNKSGMYEVTAEGPIFELGGGEARLAVGAGYRKNEFLWDNLLTGAATIQGEAGSRFGYAEINLPLVNQSSNTARVRRLELTAALRGENHDAFGGVTTPKVGIVYAPNASITLKSSWGKSFKAPTLLQLYREQIAQLTLAGTVGGVGYPSDATVLIFGGGNADLEPERARTWTTSVAFHPETVPGLELELTWFDIDYTDRVVEPITNFRQALFDPAFAEFVRLNPSAEEQAAVIAAANRFANGVGAPYDPSKVVAILQFQYVNANDQKIRGLDLSGSYRLDVASGQLTFRGSSSWLDSSQRISTSGYDLAGTLHNPAKLNSRIGAVWNRGGISASTFVNYVGGVENRVSGVKTGSFATLDMTFRYAMSDRGGVWSGLEFALAASNLFDRAPPLYTPAGVHVPPYDSTNYSPVGRFVNLSLSKHW